MHGGDAQSPNTKPFGFVQDDWGTRELIAGDRDFYDSSRFFGAVCVFRLCGRHFLALDVLDFIFFHDSGQLDPGDVSGSGPRTAPRRPDS